jgi:ATP-dependent protease HslVU (ClpYQ) peptidase subunit
MTTIAWDGETLAADGRVTSGTITMTDTFQKLHVVGYNDWVICGEKIAVIALAGNAGAWVEVQPHLLDGLDTNSQLSKAYEFQALAVTSYGKVFELFKNINESEIHITHAPYKNAIGSGYVMALTAMDCGLDAVAAVEMAIKRDSASGGTITTWKLTK